MFALWCTPKHLLFVELQVLPERLLVTVGFPTRCAAERPFSRVSAQVFLQRVGTAELPPAIGTRVRPSHVASKVPPQVAHVDKSSVADAAHMGPQLGMSSQVGLQVAQFAEAFPALVTRVRTLLNLPPLLPGSALLRLRSRVRCHVFCKPVGSSKACSTPFTPVRPLSSVYPHVDFQITPISKSPATKRADSTPWWTSAALLLFHSLTVPTLCD